MREPSQYDQALDQDRPSQSGTMIKSLYQLKFLQSHLRPYRGQVLLALLSLFLGAGMVLAFGRGVRSLIDHGFTGQIDKQLFSLLFGLLLMVGLLALASFGRTYYVTWIGERVVTNLRQQVFDHILKLDISFYEQIRIGELIARLTTDTSLIQILLGTSAAVAVRNFLLFVGGIMMMVSLSPWLTLLSLSVVPLVILPIIAFGRRVRRFSRLAQDKLAEIGGYIDETLNNIRTVQSFTHEAYDSKHFQDYSQKTFQAAIQRNLARSFLAVIVITMAFSAILAVLWVGAYNVADHHITTGELSAFIFYAVVVAGSFGSFSEILGDLQRAAGAAERLLELLLLKPCLYAVPPTRTLPEFSRGIVAMHGVSFAYPSNPEHPALKDITLSVAPGEKIAIVGPSGAGKSTLFSLLMRFYDPQGGSIFFDGINIKDVDVKDLRTRIGLVAQDPSLFSASVYDNILYGRPDATEQEVWQAVEFVQIHDFLPTLPHGIHTLVGTRGVRLSGGQKQRIAIARAILRDPSVLLLDEATNALDAVSEDIVQKALKHLMSTRTTIIIAHRLATVLNADRIIVLEQGHIRAVGTHAELITQDPLYQHLAMLQFADSRALGQAGILKKP